MRFLIAFFLSLCIAFNAAAAVGTDVCAALAHGGDPGIVGASGHDAHSEHHAHNPDHDTSVGENMAPPDPGTLPDHGDHSHPHQCFTSVPPGQLLLPVPASRTMPPMAGADDLLSRTPARLERPPRPALL